MINKKSDSEHLKAILFDVYHKDQDGATLEDVMKGLQEGLSNMMRKEESPTI